MSSAPRRPMPPPLRTRPKGLWRDTPPAIFPPVLGLLGLGLGWREAAAALGAPGGIADLILGASALLFVFCVVAWGAKPLRRPAVMIEELRVLPGRAGVAAMAASVFLLAAALGPLAQGLALGVLGVGVVTYVVLIVLVLHVLLTGPVESRTVTPVFHLIFVGPILAPLSAIELGFVAASRVVFFVMIAVALAIWLSSAVQLLRRIPPAPLRPLLAIHLAPASLFTIVGTRLGLEWVALGFAVLAVALLLALLAAGRWITEAGFSPLWGAFTFPMAAFATALLSVSGGNGLTGVLGGLALVATTLAIPPIAYRVFQAWTKGQLAERTNAAQV